jgi:hypothetical protein
MRVQYEPGRRGRIARAPWVRPSSGGPVAFRHAGRRRLLVGEAFEVVSTTTASSQAADDRHRANRDHITCHLAESMRPAGGNAQRDPTDRRRNTKPPLMSPPTRRSPQQRPGQQLRCQQGAPIQDGALHGVVRGAPDGATDGGPCGAMQPVADTTNVTMTMSTPS